MIVYVDIDFFNVNSTSKNKTILFRHSLAIICLFTNVIQNNTKPYVKRTHLAHVLHVSFTIIILCEKNASKASINVSIEIDNTTF